MSLIFVFDISDFSVPPAVDRLVEDIRSSAITIALESAVMISPSVTIKFKADLSPSEESILASIVSAHTGIPTTSKSMTSDGVPYVTVLPDKDGVTNTVVSPNLCDRNTWYASSQRVINEVLSTVDNINYTSANTHWIDLRDGNLTNGHRIADTYKFEVSVNSIVMQHSDRGGHGGDYTISPDTGIITFRNQLQPSDVVTATYSHSVDSNWVIEPSPGCTLVVKGVEVQFTDDVDITTTAVFQLLGAVEHFRPDLIVENGGPIPSGTIIPLSTSRYETMYNYIEESRESLPIIPAIGGDSWRGMPMSMVVYKWPYTNLHGQPIRLDSSKGMSIAIYLENHIPLGGTRATATVYSSSHQNI